ncbi:MAG: hypothetical protein JWO42_1145 [Chloroflexi bacterium]|nr:hypothetical protein [Chloroflexota bacterium]
MPKRNQWHYDTPYRNNKKKSMVIITGNYKKRETYKKQAALHQDPGKLAQKANPPKDHPRKRRTLESTNRIREKLGETRSGSDSNAHKPRKFD